MTDSAAAISASHGGLIERLGIAVEESRQGAVRASMPVEGNTQPYGLLHGGATAALAETVGSLAAMAHAGPGRVAVGVDLSITHHTAVTSGYVHAIAVPVHEGRSVATYDITVVSDQGKRVATARLTCYMRDAPHT